MKHQLKSFKVAFDGIWYTIKHESHMRFHMVAGFYVILFSYFFFHLSKAQWGVILLLISSVMTAEIFNTSLEEVCNLNTQSYDPIARIAKDVAAGAVLILTVAAVVVAFVFYFDMVIIGQIINFFLSEPLCLTLLIISFILSAVFVILGPIGMADIYYKIKRKKRR